MYLGKNVNLFNNYRGLAQRPMNHQNQIVFPSLKQGNSGITIVIILKMFCFFLCRRELRKKGKGKVPLKSRDWVLAKKQRLRKQGKYVIKMS